MVKAKKEERIKQTIQYKESFIKLLKNCKDITAESTPRQVEQLLGNTEAWQKMDAKEREDEVYSYLKRLKQMEREVRDGGESESLNRLRRKRIRRKQMLLKLC